MVNPMRINARLDESSEEKIEKIKRVTKKSTTDIIKESVDLYYKKLSLDVKENNRKLLKSLSGIADGPKDLSENYKKYLTKGLSEKYDID